ncbi:MAG: formate dehydrogenase accessory sulfurtransferase FdhD [Actinomycetota bacterium]|nr:formate dehydrogenase accessory sulfurtransferase FdhD [Actinomycetota bacterium]
MSKIASDRTRSNTTVRVTKVRGDESVHRSDVVAAEEPMEIRVGGWHQEPIPVAVTMRTPGNDFELACGFLFTEGLIGPGDVAQVSYCDSLDGDQEYNVVTVRTAGPVDATVISHRNFYSTSSCGICGKASLEEIEVHCAPIGDGPLVRRDTIVSLPERLRSRQRVFDRTGGLHAAGLFSAEGEPRAIREDIGRHNAVDKIVGRSLLAAELPLGRSILLVSGRAGFEIVQKAAVAGIPVLCAVSAPSSLAVEAADRLGMTLIGFLRDESFNIYAHPERIDAT